MKEYKIQGNPRKWIFADILLVLESQVLVFPLLVVFLACASFLFGGRCAAWQWWAAVGAVVGVPFLKKGGWRAALVAAGLFAGMLVAVKCLLPPVFWDNVACPDMQVYHLPQIQLLIEGWNPVEDPLAEGICAKLGLDLWGMAPLHVAFLPKTMAVFAAVAYTFVGDPTGLTIPGLAILWLGVAVQAMRQFKGKGRFFVFCALVWILPLVDNWMFVDLALAFVACGLVFTMAEDLRSGQFDWFHLGVWTIWMGAIKLNGVLGAGLFWSLYAGSQLVRHRSVWKKWLGQMATLGMACGMAGALVMWNPYGTSWTRYGHPLYPFATVNQDEFPVKNLTWDMRSGNEDYRQMSRAGLWFHEYVSPSLANAFYSWKLARKAFAPQHLSMPSDQWANPRERLALWLLFAVLLLHPRGRLWGLGGLLLSVLVPRDMIGFLRYTPWLSALGCLAVALWGESALERWGSRWRGRDECGILVVLGMAGALWLWQHARDVEFKAEEVGCLRKQVHVRFWKIDRNPDKVVDSSDFVARYHYLACMENHGRLLSKELGWTGLVELLPANGWQPTGSAIGLANRPLWKWDEREWFSSEQVRDERHIEDLGQPWYEANVWDGLAKESNAEPWLMTPWWLYYVPWDVHADHLMAYWDGTEPLPGETGSERLWRRTKNVAKVWCATYPAEVWKWLMGRKIKKVL